MKSISANNPTLKSWIAVPHDSDFPIQNIPFGIIRRNGKTSVATRIDDTVVDLSVLADAGLLNTTGIPAEIFNANSLNRLLSFGKQGTRSLRNRLSELLNVENQELQGNRNLCDKALIGIGNVDVLMPVEIGDYTDFYSSEQHAYNVGCMFRDPNNALLPNWKYIPVGYHGRASSITVSGTNFHRPLGQMQPKDDEPPVFGPCKLLDFELEMGFITYNGKPLGARISTVEADDYIFGMVVFNDWSARDIQKWEYVPLGPFLAKNFFSCMSAWVVTLDALEPYRVAGPIQKPEVFDYLKYTGDKHIDIKLGVDIIAASGATKTVSESNYRHMYWNMAQQLAHHTINGCNVRAGDMMASGTISGPQEGSYGSMLEITWRGTKPVQMPDGTERKFIQDGDTVVMRAHCEKDGMRIGFGEVRSKALSALN